MRIRRCYIEQALSVNATVELDKAAYHHIVNVLRARQGDRLQLFNDDGYDYAGTLAIISRHRADVQIGAKTEPDTEPVRQITLLQAIAKGERMTWIMQKATELGVSAIQPMHTERSIIRLQGQRLQRRLAHWQAVMISACEQCGRARLPKLHQPRELRQLTLPDQHTGIILQPHATDSLLTAASNATQLMLAVGPEGGFSTAEIAALETTGFQSAHIGSRILRTETAGIAALSLLNLAE